MADIKLTQLIPGGAIQPTDIVETTKDVGTTPISRSQTYAQVYSFITSQAFPSWSSQDLITNQVTFDIANQDSSIRRGASGGTFIFDDNGAGFSASITMIGTSASNSAFNTLLLGIDSLPRFNINYEGKISFGDGSSAPDTFFRRFVAGANILESTIPGLSAIGIKFSTQSNLRAAIVSEGTIAAFATGDGDTDFDMTIIRRSATEFLISATNAGQPGNVSITGGLTLNESIAPRHASADFQVNFDSSTPKGSLLSKGTTDQRNSISSPAEGLYFYDTDLHQFMGYNGTAWVILG